MLTRTTFEEGLLHRGGTVRTLAGLVAVMLMAMVISTPAWARVVRMQTVVNLTDHSDPGVKRAVKDAFDTSLRGAVAMGFARIRVDGIQVLQDVVVLATVAMNEDDDDEAPDNTRDQ
jgi:hypothetical protein